MHSSDFDNKVSGKILIIDDVLDNLRLLSKTLTDDGYEILCAKNGKMALMSLQYNVPDLILLDIKMPEMSGYDVCQALKENPDTCEIPVLFLSASNGVEEKVKAFELGGVDYITKPFEIPEVLARVKTQMSLLATKKALKASNRALKKENQERRKAEEKLIYHALHDSLTGLPNRTLFLDRLDQILRHVKRDPNYKFAVLFIDLDRFKLINDSLGHSVGDDLLVSFAQLLKQDARANDTVARLGGDEFTIILDQISDKTDAIRVAERIQDKLKRFLPTINLKFCTSASIGIVLGNNEYQNSSDLLRDADLAMYRAKELGKARYAVFNAELHQKVLHRLEIESNLRVAIQKQELILYYQPILSLKDRKLIGFESLLRWKHAEYGILSAAEFISIAEDSGLIVSIGEWVLRKACSQLKQWQKTMPVASNLTMNVNLSSAQLYQGDLVQTIDRILAETSLDPHFLKLEITESILLNHTDSVIQMLAELGERGILLCLDDFGTGYSCLSYLHRLPIDVLKIDRSFVSQMQTEVENYEIVRTIITLGRTLGMKLVAEGIELEEQVKQLQMLDCDFGQGDFLSPPLNSQLAQKFMN